MKAIEWWDRGRPSEILPKGTDPDYPWHFFECDKCGDILGFQQYPNDGDQYCLVCGMMEKHVRQES
jgi:hypothetical protein